MKSLLHCILLLMLFLLSQHVNSQTLPSNYKTLDITNGLSQNAIFVIHQDTEGFIWIGTYDGLNRYDGYEFKTYRYDPFDTTSINSIHINDITEDQQGNLIIATDNGLSLFNRETEVFTNINMENTLRKNLSSNFITSLYKDKNEIVWIGTTRGICTFNPRTNEIIPLNKKIIQDYALDKSVIWKINGDNKGNIWIGTAYRGLYKYDPVKETIIAFYRELPNFDKMNGNFISSIIEDSKGNIWIGSNNGLNKIVFETNEIKSYLFKEITHTLDGIGIQSILETSNGQIIAGTADYGLYIYNPEKDNFVPHDIVAKESGFLSGRSYQYLFEDISGTLWLGTRNQGARIIDLYQKPFDYLYHKEGDRNSILENSVYSIMQDKNKNIWFGTLVGMSKLNPATGKYTHFIPEENNPNTLSDNRIWAIFESSTGHIYVGTTYGMNIYDPQKNKFKRYITDYKSKNQIADNEIFAFNEDNKGQIWIGTVYGLSVFNPKTESFKNYFPDSEDSTSISNNTIWSIHIDKDNQIWIGTNDGFNKYKEQTDDFIVYRNIPGDSTSLSHNSVNAIHEDQEGTLWIGTSGFGINKFDKETEIFKSYTIHDGLPNNTIYSILSHKDNIWCTTNNGLVRLNKNTEEITVFNHKDGLQSNEFNFANLKSNDGKMYFGGVNGISSFYPDSIKPRDYMPPLVFTNLKVNNVVIKPGQPLFGIIPLKKAINLSAKIELNHKIENFSIEFAVLNYAVAGKIKYKYKLDKINTDWVDLNKQNSINFTKLNPGTYNLNIIGTNQDGIWMNKPRTIQIIIHPPWWKTKGFRGVELILLLGLIILIIKLREKKLIYDKRILEKTVRKRTVRIEKQKEEIEAQRDHIEEQKIQLEQHKIHLEEKVEQRTAELRIAKEKAEESDQLKSAFLENMSHEIRTPLNAIVGFSELVVNAFPKKEKISLYPELIKSSSNDLLHIISDIIDIAKIESQQLRINYINEDINKMFPELHEIFQQHIKRQNKTDLELEYICEKKDEFLINTDHKRLKQVLSNLINNAIKFTDHGHVKFGYQINGSVIHFFVEDTGIGIQKDHYKQIFERFRKISTDKNTLYRGTGLGLAISEKIIRLLKGKIWVESEFNKGSTFHCEIPLIKVG